MRGKKLVWVGLCALALTACGTIGAEHDPAAAQREDGRAIAESQCATCHAVRLDGQSPNPNAPVFRHILARYNEQALTEELIAGIQVAHPMPTFQFNPQGADALVAYLRSIQTPEIEETR